jgi:hypothetical protein
MTTKPSRSNIMGVERISNPDRDGDGGDPPATPSEVTLKLRLKLKR